MFSIFQLIILLLNSLEVTRKPAQMDTDLSTVTGLKEMNGIKIGL
jgi:hypothetical protein